MSKERANERINSRVIPEAPSRKPYFFVGTVVVIVVIGVLIGVICYLMLGKEAEQEERSYNRVVTPDNVEEIIGQLDEQDYTPMGSYEVKMNTNWVFPDGDSYSTNSYVENSVNNRNTVFFTIALETDPDTVIYDSPFIEPGSYMEAVKLEKNLPAGVYEAILTYHLVNEQEEEISQVSIGITLTITN